MNTGSEVNQYGTMAEIYSISYIDKDGIHQVNDDSDFEVAIIIFLDGRTFEIPREEYAYLNDEIKKQINKAKVQ